MTPRPNHAPARPGRDRSAALVVTAAILFVIANLAPIATLDVGGNRVAATIFGTASFLWGQHRVLLAALVMMTAVLMPALEIGLLLYVLVSARRAAPCSTHTSLASKSNAGLGLS